MTIRELEYHRGAFEVGALCWSGWTLYLMPDALAHGGSAWGWVAVSGALAVLSGAMWLAHKHLIRQYDTTGGEG